MASCGYCGTTILFGGARIGDQRFCSARCAENGRVLAASRQVPESLVQQELWRLHQGNCPRCGSNGPVDVHTNFKVWSALVLTRWSSIQLVGCRRCGRNGQLGAILFCAVLGWWGFPWGLIITPVQIVRNLTALMGGPDPQKPSAQLESLARIGLVKTASAVH